MGEVTETSDRRMCRSMLGVIPRIELHDAILSGWTSLASKHRSAVSGGGGPARHPIDPLSLRLGSVASDERLSVWDRLTYSNTDLDIENLVVAKLDEPCLAGW